MSEYSGFTAVDDLKENGKLTLGENTADNGGVRLAYMALLDDIAGKTIPKIDGFTPGAAVVPWLLRAGLVRERYG